MFLNDFVQSDTLPQVARVLFSNILRPFDEEAQCFTKYLIGRENVGEVRCQTQICNKNIQTQTQTQE